MQDFAEAGANMYCFHLDAVLTDAGKGDHPDAKMVEVCKAVRDAGMYVGVAIKPGTPVETLYPYIDDKLVDQVDAAHIEVCLICNTVVSNQLLSYNTLQIQSDQLLLGAGVDNDC